MRRRVAGLVAVLLVVSLLVWGLTALGGGRDDDSKNTAATETSSAVTSAAAPSTSQTAASSQTSSGGASSSSAPSSGAASSEPSTAVAQPGAKPTCELRDLQITATSDKATYGGEQPNFFMTVDNPTAADCEINLDEQQLRFEVYSIATNERIWADTDCYPAVETGKQVFKAGQQRHFQAQWSRLGSAPQQCTGRPEVPAGGYFLHAVIGDNPSKAYTFNLR